MGFRHTVTVEVDDGTNKYPLNAFKSLSLSDTYTDPLGSLSFVVAGHVNEGQSTAGEQKPLNAYFKALKRGNVASLAIDDKPQFTGIIQRVVHRFDPNGGWEMEVSCQSLLANAYYGSLHKTISISDGAGSVGDKLKKAIVEALKPYGFTEDLITLDSLKGDTAYRKRMLSSSKVSIAGEKVLNRANQCPATPPAGPTKDVANIKLSELQSKPDDTAYGFCQRILSRCGVLLKADETGKLFTSVPDYKSSPMYTAILSTNNQSIGGRILGTFLWSEDNTNGFAESIIYANPEEGKCGNKLATAKVTVTAESLASRPEYGKFYCQFGAPLDYKPKKTKDKYTRDSVMGRNACILQLQRGTEDSVHMTFSLPGFRGDYVGESVSQDSPFYTVNTMMIVQIDPLGFNESWWIYSKEFIQDSNGQVTKLKLIPPKALQIGDAAVE